MASDLISERRAEWQAALDVLLPQIRGLEDKVNDALSDDLRMVLRARLDYLNQRLTLINEAVAAQDKADVAQGKLEDHGYPALPDMEISPVLLAEFDKEVADDLAARSGFDASPPASTLTVTLGTPTPKPE